MKRANLFLLILCCILLNHAANAALTATTTIANCNQQGSISLSSTFGAVTSFSYSGTSSGTVTGNAVNLNCSTYSVTATLSSGSTETATNIIVDHEDHIQLKNWYLTGNIPSTSVNWGATLNDPTMTGWTGLSFYANRCLRFINLTGKGITGNIPNFSFSNIDKIILTNNSMNGTIPNFNMPKLTYLDITRNQFSGNIPNFSSLPMLQILLLNDNQLSGTIPNFAGSPDIKSLNLSLNKLSGTIPNFNFPLLHSLYLNYNQLSGQIPPFNFPNLYLLDLSGNNLSGCIPIEIKMNSLNISSSNGNISGNPNLYNQDWSTYYGANSVGACMSCLAATATISVAGYKLNTSTNLTSPKYLWSSGETNSSINITNSGTYSVTITQSNGCTKSATTTLSVPFSSTITNASCGSQGKIEFPSNSNIVSYAYAGTSTGTGQGKSINLAQGVYNVTLTESSGATSTISNLTIDNEEHQFLKNWYLNNEGIAWNVNWGATINDATMASWTGITKDTNGCVSEIDLSFKSVKGNLPNFNFLNLQKINLWNNEITGSVPNFNLPSLIELDLAVNQLTGTVPNFTNLPNLTDLNLGTNQLTGGIPNFSSLANLQWLGLSYNQLSGSIPNFNNTYLRALYLNNNQLSGSIPNFNLPILVELYLFNNQLSGTIPNFNLANLGFLQLSNNQLTGTIPNFNLPELYNLRLNNNQLNGTIPKLNLSKLRYLYLNNNQLSGCIPLEIKYNSPLIGSTNGNVTSNPSLNTQSWSNYWNSNTGACPAAILNGKVFLNSVNSTTGLMDNYVKTLASFPTTDPYSYHPLDTVFKHVNNPIVAQVPTSTLSVTGNNSIVDWVFLELRNGTSGSTSVAYTKSALLQKDGDIVGMNGTSPVIFDNTTLGNYYVTVRHRNHLGFRTANPIALSLTPATLNFTNNSVSLYGVTPLTALSTTLFAMNGGDANFDGSIDALDTIKWELQNGLFDEYTNNADYNLDGSVDAFDSILWELNNGKYQELD